MGVPEWLKNKEQEGFDVEAERNEAFHVFSIAGGNSNVAKNHGIPVGNFYLREKGEDPIDLGNSLDVLLVAFKPRRRFHIKGVTVCKSLVKGEGVVSKGGYELLDSKEKEKFGPLTETRSCKECAFFDFKERKCNRGAELLLLDVTNGLDEKPKWMFLECTSALKGSKMKELNTLLQTMKKAGYPRMFAGVLNVSVEYSDSGPLGSHAAKFELSEKEVQPDWYEHAEKLRYKDSPADDAPLQPQPSTDEPW